MKQSEKLDLLLKGLYDFKNDGNYYPLGRISQQNNIPIDSHTELRKLAFRLRDDNFINALFTLNEVSAELTSYGIEYCEGDSYTYTGKAIIHNTYINIENSSDTTIVSQSEKITLEKKNEQIKSELKEAIKIIRSEKNIDPDNRKILIEKLNNSISNL